MRRLLGAAAILVILGSFTVGNRIINGKRGERYHQQLIWEFSSITPLPNASRLARKDDFSVWNSHSALVGETYVANRAYADIREHYSKELRSKGWHLVDERPIREWGRDLGGREETYCKGYLAASLQYAGERAQYGWTYALDLTWGVHDCKRGV